LDCIVADDAGDVEAREEEQGEGQQSEQSLRPTSDTGNDDLKLENAQLRDKVLELEQKLRLSEDTLCKIRRLLEPQSGQKDLS
jgi:hypothetical protein